MTSERDSIGGYLDVIADDTEETRFLKSTPWIIDAALQYPTSLISGLRYEAGRFKELARQPRFSFLTVLRDTSPRHLNELILSARCQSYENWELVLVDDGSSSRKHLEVANRWIDRDKRIHLRILRTPQGPSRARNLAIEASSGDYLIVTDGDGVLHPTALGGFARYISSSANANFLFTNEAEIDLRSTELTNFLLKPPFDLFTLLRLPYVGRLYAVGRDLLEEATRGGPVFRAEYDGVEEHDLLLRLALTEGFESRHLKLFSYYRRARSKVLVRLTDDELLARRRRLVEEFVPRVYPDSTWSLRMRKDRDPLASTSVWLTGLGGWERPSLLIVIPFKDHVETTIQSLESIEQQQHKLDVLVALVNNRSSQQQTLPRLRSWIDSPRASRYEILDHDGAFNYAKLNNGAVARLGGDRDLILLLNNDVDLTTPQALQTMAMQLLADRTIGFIGIKLYYPDGNEIQHGGVRIGANFCGSGYNEVIHGESSAEFVDAERICPGVTFACAMTRRETFERLGGLEEIFVPNAFGDVDMCLKALDAGYRNYYLGSVSGIHHESKSRGSANEEIEFSFLYERHGRAIATWRLWHLNRSYRYAWPLQVLPWNYPPPPPDHDVSSQAVVEPDGPRAGRTATTALPLRYRLADRLNGALKLGLGPFHGALRSGVFHAGRGYRALRQPGTLAGLGRRLLSPVPLVGQVARRSVRLARRMKQHCRIAVSLLKSVRRNPGSARLLAMGLRHGGSDGLHHAIQILVPATDSRRPSTPEWFEGTRPTRPMLARMRRRRWPATAPKFTVITAVYNVPEEWLRQAIDSVIAQTYPHWEMICINDNSSAPHIRPVLDEISARDPRVRVIHCATNGGVSRATNRGLALATGDYVALMDHDDFMEPHALQRFAEVVIRDHPDMIYSDEAMTDVDIKRVFHVTSRSSFSYDYYLSHPYFVHLIAVRTEVFRRVGGLNEEMTISQDVDLGLRLFEACRDVAHVPEVLYRWRIHPGSLGHQQKTKVSSMTRGALERHFTRMGLEVEFDDESHFNYRDLRFARTAPARVAIIIPTSNQGHRLRSCVASLEYTVPEDLAEIVIVDRAPEDPPARAVLDELAGRHRILRHEGAFNPSAMFNRSAAACETATHYLFLHDDTEAIAPGWLEHMLGYAQRADVGIVGATLLFPDETIQHAGVVIGLNGTADHVLRQTRFRISEQHRFDGPSGILLSSRDVSAVTAACLLIRADVFERLGGFDLELTARYADLDLCLRARALGYKVIQDAYAVLYHAENERNDVVPAAAQSSDLQRFMSRHGAAVFGGDPFYGPLLSRNSTDMPLVHPDEAPRSLRSRTTPIVLPGRAARSRSLRLDTGSPSRASASPASNGVSAYHCDDAARRDGSTPS